MPLYPIPDGPDLERFVQAQAPAFDVVVEELTAGRKDSHWIWYVFPQLRGLGHSMKSHRYGLSGSAEAVAYWAHPLLGARLKQCVALLLTHRHRPIKEILGPVDAVKLRSCATLFEAAVQAAGNDDSLLFAEILDVFFDGQRDPVTLERLLC